MNWDFLRNRIKTLCEKNNLSIKEMCEKSDVNYKTFYGFFIGTNKTTSLDNIQGIAKFFQVTIDYLLERETKKREDDSLSMEEAELVRAYRNANMKERNTARYVLGLEEIKKEQKREQSLA